MSYVSNVEPVACSVSKKANAVLIHEPARLTDGETAASERGESLIPRALCDVERHVVDPLSVAVQVLLDGRGHLKWPQCGRLKWPHLRPTGS